MAIFAESAPQAHLVYGPSPAGARPGLGPPPRCACSALLTFVWPLEPRPHRDASAGHRMSRAFEYPETAHTTSRGEHSEVHSRRCEND